MDLIVIRSEAKKKAAIDRLDRAQLPAVLEIRGGVELRSTAQNAAYRSLVGQIASMTGQEPAELHRHFGRRFLDFDEDRVGAFGALVPSSTRRLSKDEMSDLIAQVHATAAWLGIEGLERGMVQQVGRRGGQIMTNDSMRQKALASALGQIENQFGKGAVIRMGEAGPVANVQTVSSGSLGLDIALGIGGVPRGRIVEAYGPEASGKTTLALHRQAIEHNHPLHQPDPNENWSDVRQPRDHNRRQCAQILRLVAARHPTRRQHQKR